MSLFTINPAINGPISSLVAGSNTLGTLYDSSTDSRLLYVKSATGIVAMYYYHETAKLFDYMNNYLNELGTIDVCWNYDGLLDVNSYLTTLAATYKGLCLVVTSSSYEFRSVGAINNIIGSISACFFNPLSTPSSSPDTFTGGVGAPLNRTAGATGGGMPLAFPFSPSANFNTANAWLPYSSINAQNWTSSFTIGLVARKLNTSTTLVKLGTTGQTSGWRLYLNGLNQICVQINDADTYTTNVTWLNNDQKHLAFTIDQGLISIYVNGEPTNINQTPLTGAVTNTGDLSIGEGWEGLISNFYRTNPQSTTQRRMLDLLFALHFNLKGGTAAATLDRMNFYKLTAPPTILRPNSVYYIISQTNDSMMAKTYISDALGRRFLPLS